MTLLLRELVVGEGIFRGKGDARAMPRHKAEVAKVLTFMVVVIFQSILRLAVVGRCKENRPNSWKTGAT